MSKTGAREAFIESWLGSDMARVVSLIQALVSRIGF